MDTLKDFDEYRIIREERDSSPYTYEFVLLVDTSASEGFEEVITATEVSNRCDFVFDDIDKWVNVLMVFAESFIEEENVEEGLDAVVEEYNL